MIFKMYVDTVKSSLVYHYIGKLVILSSLRYKKHV